MHEYETEYGAIIMLNSLNNLRDKNSITKPKCPLNAIYEKQDTT